MTADPTDTIFTITFGGTLQTSLQPLIGTAIVANPDAATVSESVTGVGGPEYVYTVTFLNPGPQSLLGITPAPGQMSADVSIVADGGAAVQVSAGAALQMDGDPLHTGATISTPATQSLRLSGTGQAALALNGTITTRHLHVDGERHSYHRRHQRQPDRRSPGERRPDAARPAPRRQRPGGRQRQRRRHDRLCRRLPTLSLTPTGVTGGTIALVADGALRSASGNNFWNGAVTVETSTQQPGVAFDAVPTSTLMVNGAVQDPEFPFRGPANSTINISRRTEGVVFALTNTYTGNTYVKNGALNIHNATALGQNTNAEQTVDVSGFSGTFTLFFTGYPTAVTTGQLPYNITANALQTAINNMLQNPSLPAPGGVPPGNGTGTASVTAAGTNFTITFGGSLAGVNVPLLAAPAVNFTGSASAIVGDLQAGGASTTTVASGAALQMQSAAGFTEASGKNLILNGARPQPAAARLNVAGTNIWGTTPILLGSNASLGADVVFGQGGSELVVAQPIHDDQQVQTLQFNAFLAGNLTLSFGGVTAGNLAYAGVGGAHRCPNHPGRGS